VDYWIRNATDRDVEGIVATIQPIYAEYGMGWHPDGYNADLFAIEDHFWRKGHTFWVAESLEEAPQILATAALFCFDPVPMGETLVEVEGQIHVGGADCSLERMYVRAEARGLGLGATLMSHAVAAARERGKRRMEIWSDKVLEGAHRFYQNAGAVLIGERICHDPDQSPEFGFILDLRRAES
jgi:GNAT superfamily N-acetyltransferase